MIPNTYAPYSIKELLSALISRYNNDEECLSDLFSETFGFPFCLFFNYGRSGLYCLLKVLGFNKKEVLIPAYTCPVVANAVYLSGNIVRFMDNDPDHFNVPSKNLESSLKSSIKMVIPTPLLGYPLDSSDYIDVLERKAPKAFVLYDNAQSFHINNHKNTLLNYADGAIFGLGEGKIISSIFGGMLLLRDKKIFEDIKRYRNHYFYHPKSQKILSRFLYGMGYWGANKRACIRLFVYLKKNTVLLDGLKNDRSKPSLPKDFQEFPTKFQAKLGLRQIKRFSRIMSERENAVRIYRERFAENNIPFFKHSDESQGSHFPIMSNNRDLAIDKLKNMGVLSGYPFFQACAELPGYGNDKGKYPNSRKMAERLITLPLWPGMKASYVEHVTRSLINCRKKFPDIFCEEYSL